MASPVRRDARRYRRRILAIGAALFGVLYVVMAPMFVEGVESDLEQRIPIELAKAGFPGIAATFDGQDGTLSCTEPLADPEAARAAAYDVWGVHSIDLDRTCRVNVSDEQAFAAAAATQDSTADTTSGDDTDAERSGSVPSSTTPSVPGFDSLAAAVSGSRQLSLLAVLIDEAGMTGELADPNAEPVTWFAPTDAAFEMLPADFLAALRSDPDTLRAVLEHHATAGRIGLADLATGPLQMISGSPLDVDADTDTKTIGGAAIDPDSDVDATNGMLHVIDGVLLPADLDPNATLPAASVEATFTDAGTTLAGAVADDDVRRVLVAATVAPGATASDELFVDAATGLDQATARSLALLIAAGRDHLAGGAAGFDGEVLYITGTYATDAARDAVLVAANAVGVEATLTPAVTSPTGVTVPTTDPATGAADELEDELNAIVLSTPILFEMNRSTIADESGPTLDQIAQLIVWSDGTRVVVEGHTDSDGNANDNLWLSRFRARAVRDALVARGVADGTVTWEGFGSQHPIVIDGVEDKAASRRVEFRVETAA